MHRHLVAVEVGIERVANQRVNLDGFSVHQHRLERLDPEPVQCGGAVQHHGVLVNHFLQSIPDLRHHLVNHALGGLDVAGELALDERLHHERLEQLERHLLGKPALVKLEIGADDDDRAAGVVHALAQQVLAEPPFLALQHVGEALERTAVRADHRARAAPVVNQSVNGFLKQALLVVDNGLGRTDLGNLLEPVVAVDDAPVQIVQVACREAAPVELHHRPEFR